MFSAGYFVRPGSSGGGTVIGTGLTPDQITTLTGLKEWSTEEGYATVRDAVEGFVGLFTNNILLSNEINRWRTTMVPTKLTTGTDAATVLAEWNKLLTTEQVQGSALISANPDEHLVTVGTLLTSLSGKAEQSQVDGINTTVQRVQPKVEVVGQPGDRQAMLVSSYRLVPNTTYVCYPFSGYTPDNVNVYNFAMLRIGYPLDTEPFEVTIVNRSPTNRTLRIYCDTPSTQWAAAEYVTFARGQYQNAIWSTSELQPWRSLRLVFCPKSLGVFLRNGNPVPGFVEYDETADESQTLLPVNNT